MASDTPAWDLYRSLLGVIETGSLSGAARALGLSQPTVGRHIATLEAELGVALFTRSPGGLRPTEAAETLRPHAEAMAAAAAALVRAAAPDDGETGVVRITASEVMGAMVLPDILAEFRDAHPGIGIELVLSNRQDDLLRREADIAVRMARPTQGALFGRRIGEIEVGLYASPSYVQKHGRPMSLTERPGHSLVGFDTMPSQSRGIVAEVEVGRDLFDIRTDSDLAQLALIRAGAGIGACQRQLAERLGLVSVLPTALRFTMETWVVMHEDLKPVRRVRRVFDALVEGLEEYLRG